MVEVADLPLPGQAIQRFLRMVFGGSVEEGEPG